MQVVTGPVQRIDACYRIRWVGTTRVLDETNFIPVWHSRGTHSKLSEVNDQFDANIAMAETLLSMLNSFDDSHSKDSPAMKLDLFHMHIRQFLIEFDARIRLGRRKKQNTLH